MDINNDFEKVIKSVSEAEQKIIYNTATIDSHIKRLQEIGFNAADNQDVINSSRQWLDNAWNELDELEKEINHIKSKVIKEHDKIISQTVKTNEPTE